MAEILLYRLRQLMRLRRDREGGMWEWAVVDNKIHSVKAESGLGCNGEDVSVALRSVQWLLQLTLLRPE